MNGWLKAACKLLPAGIACFSDLYTKSKIRDEAYEKHPVTCLGGKVTITRWFNQGAMLGAFKDHLICLKLMMCTGIALLSYLLFLGDHAVLTDLGLSMALGGAAGNTYERMRYGKVTDFIRFNTGSEQFQRINFNIGDFAVFAGIVLMCIGEILKKE